jgi:DNA-binding response OmpR family regulator
MSVPENRPLCLLVEDQALIGMSIEAYLEDAGCDVSDPLGSGDAALAWLAKHEPSLAILDYGLKDGSCTRLAAELNRRGVPFIVYSGHARPGDLPEPLRRAPWIEKPADRATLLRVLASVSPALAALTPLSEPPAAPEAPSVSP